MSNRPTAKHFAAEKPVSMRNASTAPAHKAQAPEPTTSEQAVPEQIVSEPVITDLTPTTPAKPAAPLKETIMTSFPAFDFAPFTAAFTELQEKAKAATEKSAAALTEAGAFAKGNAEALAESGKLLTAGLQELTTGVVAESRSAFEALTADAKELAAATSPADFFKLQSDFAKKQIDAVVAMTAKHSEALLKLAGEVTAPISGRVTEAVEKIKTAA